MTFLISFAPSQCRIMDSSLLVSPALPNMERVASSCRCVGSEFQRVLVRAASTSPCAARRRNLVHCFRFSGSILSSCFSTAAARTAVAYLPSSAYGSFGSGAPTDVKQLEASGVVWKVLWKSLSWVLPVAAAKSARQSHA